MLQNYFGTKQIGNTLLIIAPIVDLSTGNILKDPKDIKSQMHANMMTCFQDVLDDFEALAGSQGLNSFRVVIKNNLEFSLRINYLSVGLTFHQAAPVLLFTRERYGLVSIGA